jgi:hypothetical protein
MAEDQRRGLLDPIDRIAENLFGIIIAFTFVDSPRRVAIVPTSAKSMLVGRSPRPTTRCGSSLGICRRP